MSFTNMPVIDRMLDACRVTADEEVSEPRRILLYSGGLDSLIAWYYLDKPPAVYVDLDTKYAGMEILYARRSPVPFTILNHSGWGKYEHEDAWLPMRNMLLIMLACAEGADRVYLVAQKGEQSLPDRTPTFSWHMSQLMTAQNKRPIIVDPVFDHMDKVAMVKWYIEAGHSVDVLKNAYSCYAGYGGSCGQCSACWRKFIALTYNGVQCEHLFRANIRDWGEAQYRPRLHEYDEDRQHQMKGVMGW